jgi:hypothetical protein
VLQYGLLPRYKTADAMVDSCRYVCEVGNITLRQRIAPSPTGKDDWPESGDRGFNNRFWDQRQSRQRRRKVNNGISPRRVRCPPQFLNELLRYEYINPLSTTQISVGALPPR